MSQIAPDKIYPAMAKIMSSINSVSKDRKNAFHGYSFRGIDDVMNEVHAHLSANGVIIRPAYRNIVRVVGKTSKGQPEMQVSLEATIDLVCCADGSFVSIGPIPGEGVDSGDKASNKAMSVALKYALLQAFCIPTLDAKDPENESPNLPTSGMGKFEQHQPDVVPPQTAQSVLDQLSAAQSDAEIDAARSAAKAVQLTRDDKLAIQAAVAAARARIAAPVAPIPPAADPEQDGR